MNLSDPVQLAVVAGLTTLGTALVTAGQTLVLEWIRNRKAPRAHDDIAEKVATRLGPPFSDPVPPAGPPSTLPPPPPEPPS